MFKDPLPRIKDIKCPYEDCPSNTEGKIRKLFISNIIHRIWPSYIVALCEKKWTSSSVSWTRYKFKCKVGLEISSSVKLD